MEPTTVVVKAAARMDIMEAMVSAKAITASLVMVRELGMVRVIEFTLEFDRVL
jgi:hypothetical protein